MSDRILVIGDYRQTLTVVRSLRRAGWRVIAGVVDPDESHVMRSRAVDFVWRHPPLSSDRFEPALQATVARHQPRAVFPVGDAEIAWFVQERERFPFEVAAPELRTVAVCQDKALLLERAAALEVPFTLSHVVSSMEELRATSRNIGYPVIVKSHDPLRRVLRSKAIVCLDAAALEDRIGQWPEGHETLLVQGYFEGRRHNVYFAADDGDVLGSVEVAITRTDRLDGTGYAVDGITVEPQEVLSAHTEALVSDLKYSGAGCAQFLVSADGRVSFLELNPRLGANYAVAAAAGLDLAVLAVDLALALEPSAVPAPAIGVRYAWTTGDLRGLKRALVQREIGPWGALRWMWRAALTAVAASTHVTWSWRDPRPTLSVLWAEFARPLVRKIRPRGL